MTEQSIIEAHRQGDTFICSRCNKMKKYYATGLCSSCYNHQRYYTNEKHRKHQLKRAKEQTKAGYGKERYLMAKIGNMDNIKKLCLDYDISEDVAEAIAMDGIILDEKMKERGIKLR